MSQVITVTGTVTDGTGATGSFSVEVTLDSFTVEAVVTPAIAPVGTMRTLVALASGGTEPYTFATPTSSAGLEFTPMSSAAGVWTFVY